MSRLTHTRPEVMLGSIPLSSIARWSKLKHTTRRTGSWQLSFQVDMPAEWRHPALTYPTPTELAFGPVWLWSGALDEPNWDTGEMVAIGSARDGETAVAITGAGVSSTAPNTVINAGIANGGLSWRRVGNFGTTPVGQSGSSGGLVTVGSVLDQWAQENDSGWAVTPGRDVVVRPPKPAGHVDWYVLPEAGNLGSASDNRVDRIFLRYINSSTHQRTTLMYPTTGPSRIQKPADITDRGEKSAAQATAIAAALWKQQLAAQSGWANGLRITPGMLYTPGGSLADLALPKGGDVVRLLGQRDPRGLDLHIDFEIEDTEYDWEDDALQVNPVGRAARDTESVLEEVGNLAVDALFKAGAVG